MIKAVITLRYTGAVTTFVISHLICLFIAHIVIRIINFDAHGFWLDFLPYFAAVMAGVFSVYGGLCVVTRLFPTIRPRIVSWVFIGLTGFLWGFIILGLSLGFGELLNETPPQAVQALVSMIAAWKMTSADADF